MSLRRRAALTVSVALLALAGCSSSTPVSTAPSSSASGSGTTTTVAPSTGSTSSTTAGGQATDAALKARLLTVDDLPGEGWEPDDSLTKRSGSSTTKAAGSAPKELCPGVATPETFERGSSGELGVGFGNESMRAFVLYGFVPFEPDQVAGALADLRSVFEKCLGTTKGTGPMPLDFEMSFIDLPTLGDESVAVHLVGTSPTSKAVFSNQEVVFGRKGSVMMLLVVATTPSRTGEEPKPDVPLIIAAANAKLAGL